MTNSYLKTKRIDFLDIAKGIGILLMVIGHCIPIYSAINRYIYYFHMPLFFIISGICYNSKKYTFLSLLKKRIKQLMIPFVTFFVLLIPFCLVFDKYYELNTFIYRAPYTMWFLLILFLVEINYYWLRIISSNIVMRFVLIIFFFCVSSFFSMKNIHLPYSLDALCAGISFFAIGNLCQNKIHSVNFLSGFICLIIIGIITLVSDTRYNMQNNTFGGFLYGYIPCLLGSFGIISVSRYIEKYKCSSLIYIGKNSLSIMIFHFPLLILSDIYLKPLVPFHILYKILEISLIIILSLIIGSFVKKNCPIIIGK